MENAYSLRKAAEQAGVPTMTFHRYKERGVIEPDVEDKKGNLTLYSEEQVRRAKDYYEQSGRSRKKSVKGEDEVVSQEKSEIVTLEARADKIRQLQGDVQRGIIEIGRELNEAKKEVPHGQWGAWLAREFEWTDRTARNFMAVAERYGNRKTFSDLKPSTLQAMLSLPAGEEEAFIAEQEAAGNPVESQSAREVIANVKAWNQRNEQPTEIEAKDIITTDSAEDTIADAETDSLQVEEEEQSADEQAEVSDLATALDESPAQGTENATRKQEFSSKDCFRRMSKQLEIVRKFLTETETEQEVKAVLGYLENFRADVTDVISLADKKLESLNKALHDTE